MHRFPFSPSFDQLPPTLPVFPLEGTIVLPHADLPLNIFEPRYLNMVEDALKAQHLFGMVQPDPSQDRRPQAIMPIGCAGRITSYSETADGRIIQTGRIQGLQAPQRIRNGHEISPRLPRRFTLNGRRH